MDWQTPSSFSIRAHEWGRGWGLTVSQWVLCPRLLLGDTRPISHTCKQPVAVDICSTLIKSIEKSYRPELAASILMCPIQTHFSFTLPTHSQPVFYECNEYGHMMDCVMHASLCVCVYVCVSTCCTIVVNSRQSCTMLFFSNEYSVTLANGDLKQTKKRENVNNLRN